MYYYYYDSPVGRLLLNGRDRLEALNFPLSKTRQEPESHWTSSTKQFSRALAQLDDYFEGRLRQFDLDLGIQGTDFQKQVWQQLVKIPYGQTISYGELAKRIGNPKAGRAVGMANGKNPVSIIIPCHRVIGADGSLTGFGGGMDVKQQLLALEKKMVGIG